MTWWVHICEGKGKVPHIDPSHNFSIRFYCKMGQSETEHYSPQKDDQFGVQREQKRSNKRYPQHLSGAALVEHVCRPKKEAWTNCVSTWYNGRFLSGAALEEESSVDNCDALFEKYKKCYVRGMAKQRKKQGYKDPPQPGSLLDEYLQEVEE